MVRRRRRYGAGAPVPNPSRGSVGKLLLGAIALSSGRCCRLFGLRLQPVTAPDGVDPREQGSGGAGPYPALDQGIPDLGHGIAVTVHLDELPIGRSRSGTSERARRDLRMSGARTSPATTGTLCHDRFPRRPCTRLHCKQVSQSFDRCPQCVSALLVCGQLRFRLLEGRSVVPSRFRIHWIAHPPLDSGGLWKTRTCFAFRVGACTTKLDINDVAGNTRWRRFSTGIREVQRSGQSAVAHRQPGCVHAGYAPLSRRVPSHQAWDTPLQR